MKPRILFLMHYLEIGGAETALIGLLNAIDYSRYDVDLFLYSHQGSMMKLLPNEVNLLPEKKKYSMLEKPILTIIKSGYLDMALGRLMAKIRAKAYAFIHPTQMFDAVGFQYIADYTTKFLPSVTPSIEYDAAISFLTPHNICKEKVKAKKKVCWIHTDYKTIRINPIDEYPIWNSFDNIVSISPDVTKSFTEVFPALKDKIVEIENIMSPASVRERAEEFNVSGELDEYSDNAVKILSVGRFCSAKNYDNVPDICKRIIAMGINIRWFIIGFGIDEELVRHKIMEAGMEDYVILLGKKTNPYPYIKACDIYAQPSRYEGKSVTVREAQILYKPVVVTNYLTAPSQVKDGVDGVIVPLDNDGCAKGMATFVKNVELQKSIVEYLRFHDYGNETEVQKIYKII